MGRIERIVSWVAIGLLGLWLLVLTVVMAGELKNINTILNGRIGSGIGQAAGVSESAAPTPWWGELETAGHDETRQGSIRIGVAGARLLSSTLEMTVTVRSSGAGDLLFEPPIVVDNNGGVYQVIGESLEQARLAFLDLITRGQATVGLAFSGSPPEGARLILIFNPDQQPTDILAPRVEVLVPVVEPEVGE